MPRKSFSRKCSSEHVKGIFVNFEKTPQQISKTISLRYVSHQKNNYFLRRNFFACGSYSAEVGFCFDNAAGKTLPKLRFFPSESRNIRRKCYFPKIMFFLKEFFSFSKTRMQLWQPCQKVFAEWPQLLISNSAKYWKTERFSKTIFSPKKISTAQSNVASTNLPQVSRPDAR